MAADAETRIHAPRRPALGGAHARRRRRAVRRRHRQGRQGDRRGLEPGHLGERPDRACGSRGDPRSPAKSSARSRSKAARSMRAASRARCASPRSTGRGIGRIYFANTREEAAAIGFDDEFLYDEIPKADRGAQRSRPSTWRCRRRRPCSPSGKRSRTRWNIRDAGDWGRFAGVECRGRPDGAARNLPLEGRSKPALAGFGRGAIATRRATRQGSPRTRRRDRA